MHRGEHGCGCDHGVGRRDFLGALGAAAGAAAFTPAAAGDAEAPRKKKGAVVRAAFVYPPSATFAGNPDGWWSWPGNEFAGRFITPTT